MQMKLVLSSLVAAGLACAQGDVIQLRVPPPGEPGAGAGNVVYFNHSTQANPGAMEFVRSEFGSGAAIKGAPYSAEAVTESVQLLPDGNRIVHTDSVTMARDSEGRTRRDMTMPIIPGMSAADAPKLSFLFDPTTNTSYTLNHNQRTASKSDGRTFSFQFSTRSDKAGGAEIGGVVSRSEQVREVLKVDAAPAMPAGVARVMTTHLGSDKDSRTEDLGTQVMEGIAVKGTRTVSTIPAGQIGNDRAIDIVSERWYSPELQTVVMTRHNDPRAGETTYKLKNVRREEPAKSLFEVPAGYTIENNDPAKGMRFKVAPKE